MDNSDWGMTSTRTCTHGRTLAYGTERALASYVVRVVVEASSQLYTSHRWEGRSTEWTTSW